MIKLDKKQVEVACKRTTDQFADFFKKLNDPLFPDFSGFIAIKNDYFWELPKYKSLPEEIKKFFLSECEKLGSV